MNKIDIKDYFIEIIDESRATIGYDCVPYKTNELVHKIYKQNTELKRLEQENAELKEKLKVAEAFNLDLQNAEAEAVTECVNYKQALEEIREIAQYECTHNCSNDSNNCTIGSCIEKRVQRKINEVLEK